MLALEGIDDRFDVLRRVISGSDIGMYKRLESLSRRGLCD